MDPYKRLKFEFNGIKNVIRGYTSKGNIGNFLNGLENGLAEDNSDAVLFYLDQICMWYKENIGRISSNSYVRNYSEHERNKTVIEQLNKELEKYDFSSYIEKKDEKIVDNTPTIFISHRSSDKKYGDALEKLITGLGVRNDQLIYTSHPLHKIPLNANIYEYLRENINSNVFVIILWSNEYLESPACLNEMGAAWVAQTDYTNMYTPNFSFGNPKYHECAVDVRKMGAVLNGDAHCKASMIELRDKILSLFGLKIDDQTWTYMLDKFIDELK